MWPIIFYFFLLRNTDLDELFDICSNIKNEIENNSGNNLFFDIQIIKSNNRIKALLIIFGHDIYQVAEKIGKDDLGVWPKFKKALS